MDFDYKKYSLKKLQDWIHDALSTGEASPHEIYSAIREAVREDYYYHKDHISRASGLLELLSGHRPVKDENVDNGMRHWGHSDLEYRGSTVSSVKQDKVKKWVLPTEVDGLTGDVFVNFPDDLLEAANLKEGDQIEWVDQGNGSYLLKKVEHNV